MDTAVPEDIETDSIDPEKYAELQEKVDAAHDKFLIRHLKRVWPTNLIRFIGTFQILFALAFVGVDLPIILMYAPRWQVFAGCWAFLFALIAGIMTIRSTIRSTWLKLNWTLVINVTSALATGAMLAFDVVFIINPNVCVSLSGCNYLSYTFTAAKPYYIAQASLAAVFLITVVVFIICYIKFGLGGSTLFDNIQKGWADPLREPMLEPYRPPPPPPMNAMYGPRMVPPMMGMRPPMMGMPPPMMGMPPRVMGQPALPPGMMPVPGLVNPNIMLRPRLPPAGVAPMLIRGPVNPPPMPMPMPMPPVGE